jgi:hypothetical protein
MTPKTRDELRSQYAELRSTAQAVIAHDIDETAAWSDGLPLMRRLHELCTPVMVLCLLDDAEVTAKKSRRVKRELPSRTWWCEGCKSFVSGPHRCSGVAVKKELK